MPNSVSRGDLEPATQDGVIARPLGAIVNIVGPASAAPEGPVTRASTVIWPPVAKVGLPASVRRTKSLAAV